MGRPGPPAGSQGEEESSSLQMLCRRSRRVREKLINYDLDLTADCRYMSRSHADNVSGIPGIIKPPILRAAGETEHTKRSKSGHAVAMALTAGPAYSFGQSNTASSTPAPENWAKKSVSEKVHALISLQNFEGSWSATDAKIPRIMGFEIPKAPKGVDDQTWVTLLVTAYLEVNCIAEEGTWGLVAEKAKGWQRISKSWLNTTTSFEEARKLARDFVKE